MNKTLNSDQRRVVELLKTNRSFAVYGAAGTGKSVVRDYIAKKVPCAVLGPTGMSMCGAGGMTVARFLKATPKTIRNAGALSRSMSRIPNSEHFTVIIDEAPMVATVEILALDRGLKLARKSPRPFGGGEDSDLRRLLSTRCTERYHAPLPNRSIQGLEPGCDGSAKANAPR